MIRALQKYRERPEPAKIVSVYMPSHLSRYLDGLAKLADQPVSHVLRTMVEDHFNKAVKGLKRKKR
jgi:hypothetical protein